MNFLAVLPAIGALAAVLSVLIKIGVLMLYRDARQVR